MFEEKKKWGLVTNKLSKYYDDISRNIRSDLNTIEKFQNVFNYNNKGKRDDSEENEYN